MKKISIFVPLFLVSLILFSSIAPMINTSESVSKKVFRLHILANSDSVEDQSLKEEVRDEILKVSESLYKDCRSVEEAVKISDHYLDLLERTAKAVIQKNGYPYSVTVYTAKEYFETRKYDHFTLPAGKYETLNIIIGKGEGHNWWCVMFPTVCLSGCTDDFDGVLTEEERQLIEEDNYIVKFKIIEIYEKIKSHYVN